MRSHHIITSSLIFCLSATTSMAANEAYTTIGGTGQRVFIQQVGSQNYIDSRTAGANNGVTIKQNGTNIRSNVYATGRNANVYEDALGLNHQIYMLDNGVGNDIQAQTSGAGNYIDAKTTHNNSKLYAISQGNANVSMISAANSIGEASGSYAESLITGNSNRVDNNVNHSKSAISVLGDANKVAANVAVPLPSVLTTQNQSFLNVQGNSNLVNTVVQGAANQQQITVVGNTNQAYTNITGNGNVASVTSNGTGNAIAVTQNGDGSIAHAIQDGSGNIASITQGN